MVGISTDYGPHDYFCLLILFVDIVCRYIVFVMGLSVRMHRMFVPPVPLVPLLLTRTIG